MKKSTSLYLDLIRFSAALMVFAEHFRERTKQRFSSFWNDHPFWYHHSFPYSQTAIIVFFVLSGYVIAHVLFTRERTPLEYSASRFGRLYSVVLPALIFVAATNFSLALKYPHSFDAAGGTTAVVLTYLGSLLFVGQSWLWPSFEIPNAPFWTLGCEVAYYIGIGLFVFARGRTRILSLGLLCVAAGPTIVVLAPTWLVGYVAYHLSRLRRLPRSSAVALWLTSAFLLVLCPIIEMHIREPRLSFLSTPDNSLGELLAAYAAALCFATNLLAFDALADYAGFFFLPFARLISWLGSMTFALYLFHMPLVTLFAVYSYGELSLIAQATLMIGGTLLIVATLGRFCERSKGAYKRFFLLAWRRAVCLRFQVASQ